METRPLCKQTLSKTLIDNHQHFSANMKAKILNSYLHFKWIYIQKMPIYSRCWRHAALSWWKVKPVASWSRERDSGVCSTSYWTKEILGINTEPHQIQPRLYSENLQDNDGVSDQMYDLSSELRVLWFNDISLQHNLLTQANCQGADCGDSHSKTIGIFLSDYIPLPATPFQSVPLLADYHFGWVQNNPGKH